MKDYGFELFWSDEDEGYIATCPDFPGLSAFGKSPEMALKEVRVALRLFIEEYKQREDQLPEPTKVISFSGQIRLRMPKELHSQLSKAADRSGVSLNTYLVSLLSERNAVKELVFELKDEMCKMSKEITQNKVLHHHYHHEVLVSQKVFTEYDSSEKGVDYGKITYNN